MPAFTTLAAVHPGAELLEALARVSTAGPVWIDGAGQLEGVELLVTGDTADAARALPGRFTLLHLVGPSGGPVSGTLARASGAGGEGGGGGLGRARSAGGPGGGGVGGGGGGRGAEGGRRGGGRGRPGAAPAGAKPARRAVILVAQPIVRRAPCAGLGKGRCCKRNRCGARRARGGRRWTG